MKVGEYSLATDSCAMFLNGFNDAPGGYPVVSTIYVYTHYVNKYTRTTACIIWFSKALDKQLSAAEQYTHVMLHFYEKQHSCNLHSNICCIQHIRCWLTDTRAYIYAHITHKYTCMLCVLLRHHCYTGTM
jgi:hypothetical protein